MMLCSRKTLISLSFAAALTAAAVVWWIGWGTWPNLEPEPLPWRPDVVLLLGGGNEERAQEAIRLSREYPSVPVVVTGDGGFMLKPLLEAGVPRGRIDHETEAESTVENAEFTDPVLDKLNAKKVVLVTNWFHAPRALKVFEKYQPDREFVAAFKRKPEKMQNWHRYSSRRERLAALYYVVRYQVWSF